MKVKRILSLVLSVAMMAAVIPCGILPASAAAGIDTEDLTLFGRTYVKDKILYLFWTYSGFAFKFDGTGAKIDVVSSGTGRCAYLCVYVDGAFTPTRTIKVTSTSMTNVVLAENLPDGEHTIVVRKRNEANYSSPVGGSATVGIKALKVDGDILEPPAAPARKIEFIGDSITCGYGNMGGTGFSTDYEDGTMTYAALAAQELDADATMIARSGIGFCTGYGYHGNAANTDCSMYPYYEKTAALPGDARSNDAWDFKNNQKDVVVINLGTNDNGCTATDDQLEAEAKKFAEMVRKDNPDALIIWTIGIMGTGRAATRIKKVVAELDDPKFLYFELPAINRTTEGIGADSHPTIKTHINRSILLAQFIAEQMGWDYNSRPIIRMKLEEYRAAVTDDVLKNYIPETVTPYREALAACEALVDDPAATAAQLNEAAAALTRTYNGLATTAEITDEYILIDTCEDINKFGFGSGEGCIDTADRKGGDGCVSVTGTGDFRIDASGEYFISMPDGWKTDWFFECWLYVSDPAALNNNCFLELSQMPNTVAVSWTLTELGLKPGWNKLALKIGSGVLKESNYAYSVTQGVRVALYSVKEELTVKLDHTVLSAGRYAADKTKLEAAVAAAAEVTADDELTAALAVAGEAASQADADMAADRIEAAIDRILHPGMIGDVDGNNAIDSTDARMVLQYYAKKIGEGDLNTAMADVDGSGTVDSTDARLILQLYAKKIDKFPKA